MCVADSHPEPLWATVDELEVDDDHQLDACHKNSDHQLAINFYQITINLVIKQSNSYRIVYKDLSQEEKKSVTKKSSFIIFRLDFVLFVRVSESKR